MLAAADTIKTGFIQLIMSEAGGALANHIMTAVAPIAAPAAEKGRNLDTWILRKPHIPFHHDSSPAGPKPPAMTAPSIRPDIAQTTRPPAR